MSIGIPRAPAPMFQKFVNVFFFHGGLRVSIGEMDIDTDITQRHLFGYDSES